MGLQPGLSAVFLEIARQAPKVHHWVYCEFCGQTKDHSLSVRGDWEYLICPGCRNCRSYKVK